MNVKKLLFRILILAPCYMAAYARSALAESCNHDALQPLITETI